VEVTHDEATNAAIYRERLETLEKEARLKSLQRSPGGHSHSHDSAIDSDLQEWETEHVDIDMVSFFNCGSENKFWFLIGRYGLSLLLS